MNAPLVSEECDRDQNKRYDEDNALFIFGQLKNPQWPFHVVVAQLGICLTAIYDDHITILCHVERSETSLAVLVPTAHQRIRDSSPATAGSE